MGKSTFSGDGSCIWEPLQKGEEAKEIVSMSVVDRDVSRTLVRVEIFDPVGQ